MRKCTQIQKVCSNFATKKKSLEIIKTELCDFTVRLRLDTEQPNSDQVVGSR